MERLNSRKNATIQFIRELARSSDLRRQENCFLCDGEKLLREALRSGAEVQSVLWREDRPEEYEGFPQEYLLTGDLFDYASPMKNSPGPIFVVKRGCKRQPADGGAGVIVLEGVQDPGNVGTVIRTADAFGIGEVILLDGCADLYAPKTVRATMGAIFRQKVLTMRTGEIQEYCRSRRLKLLGAALSERAESIEQISLEGAAVAVGSEGRGLSPALLELCEAEVIIPMSGEAESLNAAVAAAILMWEMRSVT